MTDERIVQIANEHFMDCNQLTRHQFIDFARAILAEAVPQCTHKYEIDSDHPNHSCCQNCGEILKDGVHVQPSLTALREHDADVCQEFANFLGIEKCEDVVKWIVAVRKGE
jgi:hypothetical protein